MNRPPLNVLVIGTGAYVCGRGTPGLGTILPAVAEARRRGLVASLSVASASGTSFKEFDERRRRISAMAGVPLGYTRFPADDRRDPRAYLRAIKALPKPGAAVICVPDDRHFAVAMAALRAGLHTMVVKPLTPGPREGALLAKEAERRGLHNAVDYHKRWDWANLQLAERCRSGELGDILFTHVEYSQQRWVPETAFRSWAAATNIFQYLGVHYVDVIHWATQAKPMRAMAVAQSGRLAAGGLQTPDAVEAIVEWRTGAGRRFASTFLTHWVDPSETTAVSYQSIKVVGTRGRFESDQKKRGIETIVEGKGVAHPNPYFCMPYKDPATGLSAWRGYGIDSFLRFFEDASDVAGGTRKAADLAGARPTFRDSLPATAVASAVTRSIKASGRWIEVSLPRAR